MSHVTSAFQRLGRLAFRKSSRIYSFMTYRLIYKSLAGEDLNDQELRSIAMFSALSNKTQNIAGLLLYHNGQIMQVLEGPKQAVLDLYTRIEKDKGHYAVECLTQGDCENPAFDSWSMGYRPVNSQGEMDIFFALSREKLGVIMESANSNTVRETLKDYIQSTGM